MTSRFRPQPCLLVPILVALLAGSTSGVLAAVKTCKRGELLVRCDEPDGGAKKKDPAERDVPKPPQQKPPNDSQSERKEPKAKKTAQEVCEESCDTFHDQAVAACNQDPECGHRERELIAAAYAACNEGCSAPPSKS
jgi:hypothetical protein